MPVADLIFVLIIVAFFALAAGLVKACDSIIGPDAEASPAAEPVDAEVKVAA